MLNYLTTISPTHLLTYDAIAALGATMSDGEWRQLTKMRARLIMEQTFERIHDAPPEVIKRLRSTTLIDCGVCTSRFSPMFKIGMFCITRFEHDDRKWYMDCTTRYEWDDKRRRQFSSMLLALGYRGAMSIPAADKYKPHEIYAGGLLAEDLGLSGLAVYAQIFTGFCANTLDVLSEHNYIVA